MVHAPECGFRTPLPSEQQTHDPDADGEMPTAIDRGLARLARRREEEKARELPEGFVAGKGLAETVSELPAAENVAYFSQGPIEPENEFPAENSMGREEAVKQGAIPPKTLEEALLVIAVQGEALQRAEDIFGELKQAAQVSEEENAALRAAKKMPHKARVIVEVDFLTQRVTSSYGGFACLEAVRDALRSAAEGIEEQRREARSAQRLAALQQAQNEAALNAKLAGMVGMGPKNPTLA